MPYQNLQDFIHALERAGELKRIKASVSPELEIAQISDRVSKEHGPALLFENVSGHNIPLLINAFGSQKRMAMALGVEDLDSIGREIEEIIHMPLPAGIVEKLKMIPKVAQFAKFPPRKVSHAPCQEIVINEPSLSLLPVIKCWPQDGGKFITLPMVFTKSLSDGTRNCGMYRLHVYDERTTGMHWHIHHDGARHFREYCAAGKRMPVAVALGGDPAATYAATAPMPAGVDEMLLAGFLRKKPVEMVSCKTIDMEVPAEAEIVLEGYVDPHEERIEGPFGDHTGYYSLADVYPVFHVECLTHRRNPVYPATIVGKPPMEDCYMGKATERIFLPLVRTQIPELVDMNLPLFGVFHNWMFVSIDKQYPFQAKKVMHSIWGLGQMMFTKIIVVVDRDVNVQNVDEMLWRVGNNVDPRRDITIVDGPLDVLDHASPLARAGSKIGIDATKKGPGEGHMREWPDEIRMSEDIIRLVERRWSEYGFR
ncbi:MAG: menaquinone biosynthesis decarboxylase [Candidatus Abyssobacteria bacterium SURF_5]|uniref:Menaquinone biosynthesis decarboxylase n=1 Tax=Abyssobacteria bacterium (strain SURF_5) TaxID=2093360 RepID=A0A3A4NI55_ABYX5|nr:MAG: menaquinone biosynthesis decarboxylase [Candidatus Abyssubacteria bacterium SURF_5]